MTKIDILHLTESYKIFAALKKPTARQKAVREKILEALTATLEEMQHMRCVPEPPR